MTVPDCIRQLHLPRLRRRRPSSPLRRVAATEAAASVAVVNAVVEVAVAEEAVVAAPHAREMLPSAQSLMEATIAAAALAGKPHTKPIPILPIHQAQLPVHFRGKEVKKSGGAGHNWGNDENLNAEMYEKR